MKDYSLNTKCVQAGYTPGNGEPRQIPIIQSTTFKYDTSEDMGKLFDLEATSSIDTRTERIVQDGMDKLMAGRTTFVIAHRLSTIRNSDCIMVLEQGRVIERGSHEQLLAAKGKYYQLYTGKTA